MRYFKDVIGEIYAYKQTDIDAASAIASLELLQQEAQALLDGLSEPPEAPEPAEDGSASYDPYAEERKRYLEAKASVDEAQSALNEVLPVFFSIREKLMEITEMSEEEIEAHLNPPSQPAQVPLQVSKAQGKSALISSGLWGEVLSYVSSIENPVDRALAEVAMNDTVLWKRDSPALKAISSALGMTEEEIDNLFTLASKIEV